MKDLILKLYHNAAVRYIVTGGMTTFVNLAVFAVLFYGVKLSFPTSNIIAIICAIAFAFFANKIVVFRSRDYSVATWIREGITFIGARLFTMLVEVIVPVIMIGQLGMNEMVAKLLIQFVILVLNFLISKFLVFKEQKEEVSTAEWYAKNMAYIWITGVGTLVMFVVWIFNGIGPFDNNSMLLVDGIHQYTPFFSEYYEKITNGGGLLYSWNVGMGGNFLSLFSYYLSSPFNLIIFLFDKDCLVGAVSFSLTLKIILSGLTMAYYLKNKQGKQANDMVIIALSLAYAFNNYMVGYNWCTMWVDTIMIFPLVILGFERLMEKRDYRLYMLTLCYALFCNYYIGFIVCLFLVFWFFMYQHRTIGRMFMNGIRFAIGSLVGAGMATMLLFPAYFGIMNTSSASAFALPESKYYGNVIDVLQQLLVIVKPIKNQVFDGDANLYCGIFVLFGAVMFLFQGKISLWKRIRYVLMLVFLVVSMNNELLNYIWHAFHNQYGIPNRFTFVFIFMLIIMAEQAFAHLEFKGKGSTNVAVSAIVLVLATVAFYMYADSRLPLYSYIVTIVLVDIYCIFAMCYVSGRLRTAVFSLLLAIIGTVEVMGNAIYGFAELGSVDTDYYLQDSGAVDVLQEYMAEQSGEDFYRADLLKSRMLDEATWHNLPSIGIFGSTVPGDMVKTMSRLGFYTGANEYLYHGATPLTNSILNVKYALVRDNAYNNLDFVFETAVEGVGLYSNPYYLPIGFMVDAGFENYTLETTDVFYNQNSWVKYATDIQDNIFTVFDFQASAGCPSGSASYDPEKHRITYERDTSEKNEIWVKMIVPEDMDLYLNCKGSNVKEVRFNLDGEDVAEDRFQGQVFHFGEVMAGQEITITYIMNAGGNATGTLSLYAAKYHKEVFESVYDELSANVLTEVSYQDGYVTGTVKGGKSGILFTSIPYDKGWKAYVDGIEKDITVVCGSFIGVQLDKNAHKIEFRYTTVGLKYGIIVSVVSWFIFIAMSYVYGRKRREMVVDEEKCQESDNSGSGAGDEISSGDQSDSEGDASDC